MAVDGSKGKVVIIIEDTSNKLYRSIQSEFGNEVAKVVSVAFDGIKDSKVKNDVMDATQKGKLVIIRVSIVSGTGNGSTEIEKLKSAFKLDVLCYAILGIKDAADAMADNKSGGMIVFASSSHSPEKSVEAYQMWWNDALVRFAKSYTSGKKIKVEHISADKNKKEDEVAKKVVEFCTASKPKDVIVPTGLDTQKMGFDKKHKIAPGSSCKK